MIRKHFRLKKIALGLAFAALVVAPTAQARVALVDGHAAPISYTAVAHRGSLPRFPFSRESPSCRSRGCAGRQWQRPMRIRPASRPREPR